MRRSDRLMKIIHTCLRVLELDRSLTFYKTVFGFEEYERFVFETFTLCYLRAPGGAFELELTANHDRTAPYAHGESYGHMAVLVDDLLEVLSRYRSTGATDGDMKQLEHEGKLLGQFFFATDPDGYKIEVLAKSGRFATQG